MKKTIFCVMGKSATGKTTLVKDLVDNLSFANVKELISTTSRPVRDGEIDGVHYNFKSKEYFIENKDNFCELISYNTVHGVWSYGIEKETILNAPRFSIVIVTPEGCLKLKESLPDYNIIPILVHVADKERYNRLIERGDNSDEVKRRIKTDAKDFENVLDLSPIIFYNYNYSKTLKNMVNEISYEIFINMSKQGETNDCKTESN